MGRVIIAPGKYVQGAGEMANLGAYVAKLGKKALIVVTPSGRKRNAENVFKYGFALIGAYHPAQAHALCAFYRHHGCKPRGEEAQYIVPGSFSQYGFFLYAFHYAHAMHGIADAFTYLEHGILLFFGRCGTSLLLYIYILNIPLKNPDVNEKPPKQLNFPSFASPCEPCFIPFRIWLRPLSAGRDCPHSCLPAWKSGYPLQRPLHCEAAL